MVATASDHEHHYCQLDTGGKLTCCVCAAPPIDGLRKQFVKIGNWVYANLSPLEQYNREVDG